MKKILILLCALTLVFCSVFSVSAANITKDEQAVLDILNSSIKVEKFEVTFPREIVIQAENYFLSEDITSSQANKVVGHLEDIIEIVKAHPKYITNSSDVYHSTHPNVKSEIDKSLEKIFKVLRLAYSYDGENVNLVGRDGVVYFSDEPIIKATGAPSHALSFTIGLVCASLCFFIIRKRVRG